MSPWYNIFGDRMRVASRARAVPLPQKPLSFLKLRLKKSDLEIQCVKCGKFQIFFCGRAAACVYASVSQETLTRSGTNESINSLKSGGERGFLCIDKSRSQGETHLPHLSPVAH